VKIQFHIAFLLSILSLLLSSAHASQEADEAASPEADLLELSRQLPGANFRNAEQILAGMEAAGGIRVVPLMRALADGVLHFDINTLELIALDRDSGAAQTGVLVLDGISIDDLELRELERIRVNNRLRMVVRDAISRINISQGGPEERRLAARELLRSLTPGNVELIQAAKLIEEDAAVLRYLDAGLAMSVLSSDAASAERIAAANQLSGMLDTPIRNLLRNTLQSMDATEEPDQALRAAVESALVAIERKAKFYGYVEEAFYGLSMGSILLLAAVGLAVTFGVMGVINMAHGEMLMLGAYTTYVVQLMIPEMAGLSIWVSIPAAFVVAGSVGILIQRYVIRYLHGRPLETLLATFGISLILQQAVRTIFSPLNRRVVSPEWMTGSWDINPVLSLTYNRLFVLIFAIIVFLILLYIMKKTTIGLQVRAVSQNRDMAKAMGIRTDRVDAMTFGLGSGIAGMAGVALSQITNVGPNLGQAYIIDSFLVVVFGGVGNLMGTLVAAFSLGMGTKLLEPAAGPVLAKIIALVFIVIFIQFRPQGLFPQKGRSVE